MGACARAVGASIAGAIDDEDSAVVGTGAVVGAGAIGDEEGGMQVLTMALIGDEEGGGGGGGGGAMKPMTAMDDGQ